MAKYIVICQQIVGDPERGYHIHYGWNGDLFSNRKRAIRNGFEVRESDDFNIGVIEGGRVVSFDWMYEPVETDEAELAEINQQIFGG